MKKKEYQNPEMKVVEVKTPLLDGASPGDSYSRSVFFSDDSKAASWHVEEE